MPTRSEFDVVGQRTLHVAVEKFGYSQIAKRLGLKEAVHLTNSAASAVLVSTDQHQCKTLNGERGRGEEAGADATDGLDNADGGKKPALADEDERDVDDVVLTSSISLSDLGAVDIC
jgi:hypothetical protein